MTRNPPFGRVDDDKLECMSIQVFFVEWVDDDELANRQPTGYELVLPLSARGRWPAMEVRGIKGPWKRKRPCDSWAERMEAALQANTLLPSLWDESRPIRYMAAPKEVYGTPHYRAALDQLRHEYHDDRIIGAESSFACDDDWRATWPVIERMVESIHVVTGPAGIIGAGTVRELRHLWECAYLIHDGGSTKLARMDMERLPGNDWARHARIVPGRAFSRRLERKYGTPRRDLGAGRAA